jgi:hypothetical protein
MTNNGVEGAVARDSHQAVPCAGDLNEIAGAHAAEHMDGHPGLV